MSRSSLRPLRIVGNWKMNHGTQATEAFFSTLGTLISSTQPETAALLSSVRQGTLQAAVAPSFVVLSDALRASHSHAAHLGVTLLSQNVNAEKSGAFTGEVSVSQLKEIGITETLIGHSERRQLFGETDAILSKKLHSALSQGMKVLFCVGETLAERQEGQTREVLRRQLRSALAPTEEALKSLQVTLSQATLTLALSIAYEPVWAIGTGVVAKPEQAAEAHTWIRAELSEILGGTVANRISLLYGGSVTPENLSGLLTASPDIDGALVGGASLKPESFAALLTTAATHLLR